MNATYLNLVQVTFYVRFRHVLIVQVTLLLVATGKEVLVILKGTNVVVGISMEQVTEDICVHGRSLGPHVPDLVTQGVSNKLVPFITLVPVVGANIWGLCVGILACVQRLSRQQTQVFTP